MREGLGRVSSTSAQNESVATKAVSIGASPLTE